MDNSTPEKVHCLIIGSGPAGYTAAIYAARANLKPVLYQGIQPGGQLTITTEVENYPGYPDGVQGPDMMVHFEKQAVRMGTDVRYGLATKVDFTSYPYKVWIDEEKLIDAEAIIVSTGASAKWLGLESEQRLNGFGVSACAVCDGFFFRGKDVAIVGAGDTAAEEAIYLSKLCSNVHMLIRRDQMRASKVMQERVQRTPNIKIHWNTETEEVLGETKVEGVRLVNTKTGEKQDLPVAGFFVAIGHQPNSEIFKGWLDMDEAGYIQTVPGTSRTNIEGVFASGDVQDKIYRQAVTAAGSGCMAALDAERFLSMKELGDMISIQLVNVQMYAFHGVFEGEEKIGNPYVINLSVKYEERDNEFANIEDTINYENLYKIIRHWMELPTGLLEKICVNIIRHIKHDYPFIKEIDLSIQKLQPPLEQFQGNVGVTMNRKFND